MFRHAALAVLIALTLGGAARSADTPKGIEDALKVLEKAVTDSKDPVEKQKLRDAITALKKVASEPTLQNHLISDLVDNPGDYKDKTLTLKVAYEADILALNEQVGNKGVPFTAKDPKNGAKLVLGLDIPKGLKVPAAKGGEVVVVTFKSGGGGGRPNVAVSITRP